MLLLKRRPFIDWLCVLAVLAVFSALIYQGLWREWSEHGIWSWYADYLAWQRRAGLAWLPF